FCSSLRLRGPRGPPLFPYPTLFRSGLGDLEQHHAARTQFQYLAAQFRADRAACPGDHDVAAGDAAPQQLGNGRDGIAAEQVFDLDRKSTRLNSSHVKISYAVFCSKK